jgi:NAD(P)-dependent dehydrogenase (short-subunit alcohol dehydrogenase family)
MGLSGERALVLGGSRGLGATTANALAAEGLFIYAAAPNVEAVDSDTSVEPVKFDLSDKASVDAWNHAVKADGGVDILVYNGVAGHLNVRMRHFSQPEALSYENFTASFFKDDTKARMKSTSYAAHL